MKRAEYSGARATVDQLLARGVAEDRPVSGGNFPGATALAHAIARGDADLAATLLQHGAKVDEVVPGKMSPLSVATWYGDVEMAAWLLARGAKVDASLSDDFSDESSALMIAVEDGRAKLVDELLNRGADVNAVDDAGYSPLLYAALTIDRGTTIIVDRLLDAGARASATAPDGLRAAAVARKTALADSIFVPGATTVRLLVESTVSSVTGDIPDGIAVGAPLAGSVLYDTSPPTNRPYDVLDFSAAVGDVTFTFDDVVQGRVFEFEGTLGIFVEVFLRGRPGLDDWSHGVLFSVFREFGDSDVGFVDLDFSSGAGGHAFLEFQDASEPIPEPATAPALSLLVALLFAGRHRLVP